MASTIFFDQYSSGAHEDFQQWMRAFRSHFYLNERAPRDFMIHKATCPHLRDATKIRLTSKKKICAPTTTELRRFAEAEGATVAPCNECGQLP